MRVTLKAVNEKLAGIAPGVELAKGAGYFLFRGGEADDWIDRTIPVATIGSLSLDQWVEEYRRLEGVNRELMRGGKPGAHVRSTEHSHG